MPLWKIYNRQSLIRKTEPILGAPLETVLEETYFEELVKIRTKDESIITKKSKKPPPPRTTKGVVYQSSGTWAARRV